MGSVLILNHLWFGVFLNYSIYNQVWQQMLCIYVEFCLDLIIFCGSDYRANLDKYTYTNQIHHQTLSIGRNLYV